MANTAEELTTQKELIWWSPTGLRIVRPTGRFVESELGSFTRIEVKSCWFFTRWIDMPMLDVIKETNK